MTATAHALVVVGVQATQAAYAQALDAGRTDDLVALFHPEGTSEIAGMGTFRGREAIREAYAGLLPSRPQLHLVGNTVVTSWTEDEATAVSSFAFHQRGPSGWVIPVVGNYHDIFRKTGEDSWQIYHKTTTYVS